MKRKCISDSRSVENISYSGERRKFPRGAKSRHNRVTSQINFRESAQVPAQPRGPGECPREKVAELDPKIRIF